MTGNLNILAGYFGYSPKITPLWRWTYSRVSLEGVFNFGSFGLKLPSQAKLHAVKLNACMLYTCCLCCVLYVLIIYSSIDKKKGWCRKK